MSEAQTIRLAAAARGLALDLHAVRVVEALAAAEVPSVLLKGPGLARRLYPEDPSRRRYSDVDVLVRPGHFGRAQEVLAELGHTDVAARFPDDEWLPHERPWRFEPAGLTVDLHRGFAGVDDPETFCDLLMSRTVPLALEGVEIQVPDATGCALLVALHAAAPGRGRKALVDLDRGVDRLTDRDWAEASRWAARSGCTESFATGLRRTPEGSDLAARLALGVPGGPVTRLAERLDLVLLHRALHATRRVRGTRARLRFVVRRLVPTPEFLRMDTAVARRGALGLGAAYVARPFRLLAPGRRTPDHRSRRRRRPGWLSPEPASWNRSTLRTAVWTWRVLREVERELTRTPLADLALSRPPRSSRASEATVRRVLHRCRARCLARALVLQRWRAAHGETCDLVVGVTAPAAGFAAHAWLADDRDAEQHHASMVEILRRPTPAEWVAGG